MMNKLGQKGLSLVQIMISVGLTGFLIIIMSKLNEQGIKTQKTLESKTDKQQWLQTIFYTQMKDSSACMNTFNKPTTRIDASKALTDLYRSDSLGGGVFFSVGDFLPSGNYTLSAIQSTGFIPNSAGAPEGICPIVMTFDVANTANDAGNITASQQVTETISFPCTVDQSNAPQLSIVNCAKPQGMNLNSLWNLDFPTPPGTHDFASWNPQSGVGTVIIGRPSEFDADAAETAADVDTANLNINLQGVQWSGDSNAQLWEGITTLSDNGLLWGNDLAAGFVGQSAYFGANRLTSLVNDVGLLFARGALIGGNNRHMSAFNLPIEVAGDLYSDPNGVSDGSNNYNYRVGLVTDGNNVIVDWNRLFRDYAFMGSGTYDYNNAVAENGSFLRWNVVDARLDLYVTGRTTSVTPQVMEESFHAYTMFADRRFIFARGVTTDPPPPMTPGFPISWNYSYTAPGSRYSFSMGQMNITSGEHNMNLGTDIFMDCSHCLGMGWQNNMDQSHYSFVLGRRIGTDAENNFSFGFNLVNNGEYAIVGGEQSSASADADFALAYGYYISVENPYEVSFGKFNETLSTPQDFVRFSVGDGWSGFPDNNVRNMLTYYNSGTLRLSIHEQGFRDDPNALPGDLFIMAPNHGTTEDADKAMIVGYNLFRECVGVATCDYFTYGESSGTGFSAMVMDDETGVQFVVDDSASGTSDNRDRNGIGKASVLDDGGFLRFEIEGIHTDKNLVVDGDLTIPTAGDEYFLWCEGPAPCPAAPSDRRLKKEIKPLKDESMLDKIKQIRPVSFRFKGKSMQEHFGFIAQEIKQLFPHQVIKSAKSYLSIFVDDLLAILIQGIQDLMKMLQSFDLTLDRQKELIQINREKVNLLEQQNVKLKEKYCLLSKIKEESLCKN